MPGLWGDWGKADQAAGALSRWGRGLYFACTAAMKTKAKGLLYRPVLVWWTPLNVRDNA